MLLGLDLCVFFFSFFFNLKKKKKRICELLSSHAQKQILRPVIFKNTIMYFVNHNLTFKIIVYHFKSCIKKTFACNLKTQNFICFQSQYFNNTLINNTFYAIRFKITLLIYEIVMPNIFEFKNSV
jgi:hypothetical protein